MAPEDFKHRKARPENIILEAIRSHPDLDERALKRLIVDQHGLMSKAEFYKTVPLMIDRNMISQVWKGYKKTFRIVDTTEQLKQKSINIQGHLGRMADELFRLRREYPDLHLVDKITMSITYMRNNLDLLKEIGFVSIVSGNETKEQENAENVMKSNMKAIWEIVLQDNDKDKVLPHFIAASQTQNDYGIFKTSNQVSNGPLETYVPYVNQIRKHKC